MYPDKVGRVVIDGVYDAYSYRTARWDTNLVDTDAVVGAFYIYCHQAGPEKCPIYADSVEKIRDKVKTIRERIEREPIPIPFAPNGPTMLTKTVLDAAMFGATYLPVRFFPTLADIIAAAESNNQSALATLSPLFGSTFQCQCKEPQQWPAEDEALYAIACGDSEIEYDFESYKRSIEKLQALSQFAAPIWGNLYLKCTEWKIQSKWKYMGPLEPSKESNPLLILSQRYDPVCPLRDAQAVHARFNGSRLLVQDSYGHCSVTSPSLCMAKHVRAYFENGTLPEAGTVCGVDELPFVGETVGDISEEDRELLDVLIKLARTAP